MRKFARPVFLDIHRGKGPSGEGNPGRWWCALRRHVGHPVETANFIAQQKRLLAEGLITQDRYSSRIQKEIFSTTAFYQYNHSYERLCEVVASLQRNTRRLQKRGQDLSQIMSWEAR